VDDRSRSVLGPARRTRPSARGVLSSLILVGVLPLFGGCRQQMQAPNASGTVVPMGVTEINQTLVMRMPRGCTSYGIVLLTLTRYRGPLLYEVERKFGALAAVIAVGKPGTGYVERARLRGGSLGGQAVSVAAILRRRDGTTESLAILDFVPSSLRGDTITMTDRTLPVSAFDRLTCPK
jgi:hypothetical protein